MTNRGDGDMKCWSFKHLNINVISKGKLVTCQVFVKYTVKEKKQTLEHIFMAHTHTHTKKGKHTRLPPKSEM